MRFVTIVALLLALAPADATGQAFHMTVRAAFSISGRGVVVTGMVEGGR